MFPDVQNLTWIVQGGSFALVVDIFGWSAYILVPRVLKAFEDRDAKFEQMTERIQERNERELERRAKADEAMVAAMNAIVIRLEVIENHGCAHRTALPMYDEQNQGSGKFRRVKPPEERK